MRAWSRAPIAARIGLIYLGSRLVTTLFFVIVAARSTPASRFGADPTLVDYVLGWDAQWYWMVAFSGYPIDLPLSDTGFVAENAWAFMPVYAYLAQWIGLPFGGWGAGALIVSLVAGYLACLALHALLRPRIGGSAALWAVIFFASGPLAALFQVGYAESLFLLLLFLVLHTVASRRFWWAYPLIVVMAYTRPGILALALFFGLYGIARWVRRRTQPLAASDAAHIIALGALSTLAGFSWPLIAAAVTGHSDAYLATELAWRRSWGIGLDGFVPVQGWVRAAQFWAGVWAIPDWLGVTLFVLLVVLVALALLLLPQVVVLGREIRLWSASYLVYLLAVFFPQSSIFRLLVPVSPLWGAVAVPRSRIYRTTVLALCLIGQYAWITAMYGGGNTFWQVP